MSQDIIHSPFDYKVVPEIKHITANEDLSSTPYAGFWLRFFATLIDSVIITGVSLALSPVTNQITYNLIGTIGTGLALLFSFIMGCFISFLVICIPLVKYGSTAGKKVLGLKVVNAETYKNLTVGQAIEREFLGKIVSSILLLGGYLCMLFSKRKQTLHDRMVNSVVVKVNR